MAFRDGDFGRGFSRSSHHRQYDNPTQLRHGNFRPSHNFSQHASEEPFGNKQFGRAHTSSGNKYIHEKGTMPHHVRSRSRSRSPPKYTHKDQGWKKNTRSYGHSWLELASPASPVESPSSPQSDTKNAVKFREVPLDTPQSPPSNYEFHKPPSVDDDSVEVKKVAYFCKICNDNKEYSEEYDFKVHLTIRHFEEDIRREHVAPPFRCIVCNYVPPSNLTIDEQSEEFLMHIACEEKAALRYYNHYLSTQRSNQSQLPQHNFESNLSQTDPELYECKMCNNVRLKERHFLRHISLQHFSSTLKSDLPSSEPYKCPFLDCGQEKTTLHNLLLHYGCDHPIVMNLYKQAVRERAQGKRPIESVTLNDIESEDNEDKVMTIDLGSLRNSQSEGEHDLSPKILSPSNTVKLKPPVNDASNMLKKPPEKETSVPPYAMNIPSTSSQPLTYGSFKIKRKKVEKPQPAPATSSSSATNDPTTRTSSPSEDFQGKKQLEYTSSGENKKEQDSKFKCQMCKRSSFSTKKLLHYHIFTSHLFKKLSDQGPYKCTNCKESFSKKGNFARHYMSTHWKGDGESSLSLPSPSANPLPQSRRKESVHKSSSTLTSGKLTARQRLQQHWQSTSLDGQKLKIEELERKILEMEQEHKEALKAKAEEFGRWIAQKETALEIKSSENKALEEKLLEAQSEIDELNNQVKALEDTAKNANAQVEEGEKKKQDTLKEKRQTDKKLMIEKLKVADLEKDLSTKHEEYDELLNKFKEVEEKLHGTELTLAERDEEIKESKETLDSISAEHEKKVSRLETQVKEQKKLIEKLQKEKISEIQKLNKKHETVESELRGEISKVLSESKSMQSTGKGAVSGLDAIKSEINDLKTTLSSLETEKKSLLGSLEKTERIRSNLEETLTEKNERIRELEGENEDKQTNLDDALQKIKDLKSLDKERKEQTRTIKQLQSALKQYEDRQFTNVKLIAGLQSENSALQKKVKDFEENNTGAEEELYEMSSKIKALEKQLAKVKAEAAQAVTERSKSLAKLESKNEEVETMKSKNFELEASIMNLEKNLRISGLSHNFGEEEKSKLNLSIKNLKTEVSHLKLELSRSKTTIAELKEKLRNSRNGMSALDETFSKPLKASREEPHSYSPLTASPLKNCSLDIQIKEEIVEDDDEEPFSEDHAPIEPTFVDASSAQLVFNVSATANNSIEVPKPLKLPSSKKKSDQIEIPLAPKLIPRKSDPSFKSVSSDHNLSGYLGDPSLTSKSISSVSQDSRKKVSKQGKGKNLQDVTGMFEETDEIVCGICHQFDPPFIDGKIKESEEYRTDWVGCNCDRWFHKQCTKLSRFSDRFSCKSVKMKCLKK